MAPDKATYESHAQVLRGLIDYHKRVTMFAGLGCEGNNTDKSVCPRITVLNDVYLGALEESLRLIEERIDMLGG